MSQLVALLIVVGVAWIIRCVVYGAVYTVLGVPRDRR
jgi:hypothetical protein